MLIEFSVENYRSFKDRVTLSMVAAKLRARNEALDRDNVVAINDKLSLLRSAVVYGANASGKSNLIKAFHFMQFYVFGATSLSESDDISVEPFLLNETHHNEPTSFEIVFMSRGIQYRYGFSATSKSVIAEWLYFVPKSREALLFVRNEKDLTIGDYFREGNTVKDFVQEKHLFLSLVAQLKKDSLARRIRDWIWTGCHTLKTIDDRGYLPFTKRCIEDGRYKKQLNEFVQRLDLDIRGLSVVHEPDLQDVDPLHRRQISTLIDPLEDHVVPTNEDDDTERKPRKTLRTRHAVWNEKGNVNGELDVDASYMESDGTLKLIALAAPIIDVLSHGWTLFLDELDSRLHPLITAEIIRLFNSPSTNPKNAQLICTTHDTNLLDRHLLRRDQIYFVEKDKMAASHLYSLADFKLQSPMGGRTVRNDEQFEKNYIQGRYGAIPYLGDLTSLFSDDTQSGEQTEPVDEARVEVGV